MKNITILDIETTPLLTYTWGIGDQTIGLNQIHTEWSILSIAWKQLGTKTVHYIDTHGDPRNDKPILQKIWEILDQSDIIIGQNSKQFDIKKINARLIENGYPPPSPYQQIDTVQQARTIAKFTSNRLGWLSHHLTETPKSEHKKYPGMELWLACLDDKADAYKELKKYNIQDVKATEDVYLKLRPWIKNHPTVDGSDEKWDISCNRCGSQNLTKRGFHYTNQGPKQQYQCNDCHGYLSAKQFSNTTEDRNLNLNSI
jgi:RNase_H superfamily